MTLAAWHGCNVLIEGFIVDEEGVDEVFGSYDVFTDHGSYGWGFTVSAWALSLLLLMVVVGGR